MKRYKWLSYAAISCILLVLVNSCDDDNTISASLGAPVITEVAAPTATATSDVLISSDDLEQGRIRVMNYGFCYSKTKEPTIYSATITSLPSDGILTATLSDLEDNTLYYVRAFATLYPSGVIYSPETEMTVGTVVETPSE